MGFEGFEVGFEHNVYFLEIYLFFEDRSWVGFEVGFEGSEVGFENVDFLMAFICS